MNAWFCWGLVVKMEFIKVRTGHVLVPPRGVCDYRQGSDKGGEEEEGNEDGLHLSCSA